MSKYEPLSQFLTAGDGTPLRLTFAQIDLLLPGRLPASARDHQAWWHGDDLSHPHCKAWTGVGVAATADLKAAVVTFTPVRATAAVRWRSG